MKQIDKIRSEIKEIDDKVAKINKTIWVKATCPPVSPRLEFEVNQVVERLIEFLGLEIYLEPNSPCRPEPYKMKIRKKEERGE